MCFFCVKQKTAYEMRISDWSSDVCSSDLWPRPSTQPPHCCLRHPTGKPPTARPPPCGNEPQIASARPVPPPARPASPGCGRQNLHPNNGWVQAAACLGSAAASTPLRRSEEHTSELQSLMRISDAVFCMKK